VSGAQVSLWLSSSRRRRVHDLTPCTLLPWRAGLSAARRTGFFAVRKQRATSLSDLPCLIRAHMSEPASGWRSGRTSQCIDSAKRQPVGHGADLSTRRPGFGRGTLCPRSRAHRRGMVYWLPVVLPSPSTVAAPGSLLRLMAVARGRPGCPTGAHRRSSSRAPWTVQAFLCSVAMAVGLAVRSAEGARQGPYVGRHFVLMTAASRTPRDHKVR
jgi:hypothetical protein